MLYTGKKRLTTEYTEKTQGSRRIARRPDGGCAAIRMCPVKRTTSTLHKPHLLLPVVRFNQDNVEPAEPV
jgi:hypothetical protein